MLRRCLRRLGSTNRYTDGSGRKLEGSAPPTDLHTQPISNRAYPVQGEVWQPVVASATAAGGVREVPTPHKGSVVVSGGGVVGLTTAAMFALRGWHTTVLERGPALAALPAAGPNARGANEKSEGNSGASSAASSASGSDDDGDGMWRPATLPGLSPFAELQSALLTRRAVDVLESAGVRAAAIRHLGAPVSGVIEHPGGYNTWLTRGLCEHHPFAVRMLAVDVLSLRRHLEAHVTTALPNANLRLFHEHAVEAAYPLRQQIVVRPVSALAPATVAAMRAREVLLPPAAGGAEAAAPSRHPGRDAASLQAQTDATVARVRARPPTRDTSLTLSALKWEHKYAGEAVDYDLLVCAEGVNSHLRELLDVEGFTADVDFGVRWFLLQAPPGALSETHVHRWLHRRRTSPVTAAAHFHIRSPYQVPMCLALPRPEGGGRFSLMVYMPAAELAALSDEEVLRQLLPDLHAFNQRRGGGGGEGPCRVRSFTDVVAAAPTVHCENLYNSVGLPSAVVLGDAAHHAHPLWMQGLAIGLEDGAHLLNQVDAYSRHFYDALKLFSVERGACGDALREMTDRCLYYERRKHRSPLIRLRNGYQLFMNRVFPRGFNTYYEGSTNHVYSKSIEEMLNGRGYTSYDYAEKQQAKHNRFTHIGRLYT